MMMMIIAVTMVMRMALTMTKTMTLMMEMMINKSMPDKTLPGLTSSCCFKIKLVKLRKKNL